METSVKKFIKLTQQEVEDLIREKAGLKESECSIEFFGYCEACESPADVLFRGGVEVTSAIENPEEDDALRGPTNLINQADVIIRIGEPDKGGNETCTILKNRFNGKEGEVIDCKLLIV